MSTLRGACRAFRSGFGLALVSAFALVGSSGSAIADDTSTEDRMEVPDAVPGSVHYCSMGGGSIGAVLVVDGSGIYCSRQPVSGLAPGQPSCHAVARAIGCSIR